jgi:AcrR family transcriptional regulator
MDDQPIKRGRKPQQGQSQNREKLIAAGYKIMGEKGVEAATVQEIARQAGVSPGLFHYYFTSKNELLLAVLWAAGLRFKDQLAQDLQAALATQSFSAAALITAHQLGHKDPAWYRLRYELFALGLRNPEFLPAIGDYLARTRQEMSGVIQSLGGLDAAQAQAAAAVMLACVDGLALQQLAQPDLNLQPSYRLVQMMLEAQKTTQHATRNTSRGDTDTWQTHNPRRPG